MVADWEWQYQGLTFGGNQQIGVINVAGMTMPPVRDDSQPKIGDHGVFRYSDLLEERHIVIQGDITGTGTNNFEAQVDLLRAAFVPRRLDAALVFKRPSIVQQRVNCVPMRFEVPIDLDYQILYGTYTVEFICPDPRIYSDALNSLTWSAANSNKTATNAGSFGSYPVSAVITGPGTTFQVKNMVTLDTVKVNTTLTAGQTMTLDFQNRTIFQNNGNSLYGFLDSTSKWWDLDPGANTVRFDVASGNTGSTTMVYSWRDAWL